MRTLKKLFPFLFLAGIVLILFWKVFFLGQVFYEGDNFHLNIPNKYFLVEQIKAGHLPLWNPYLFIGIPYFADFNIGTLNVLNILYFIFPVPRALTLITVLDFFLIGTFQYLFLRLLKLSELPALLGAVIFAFAGMPFNLYGNMTYLNVVVYIPLVFSLAYLFVEKKQIKFFLLLVLVQALQFLAGHPQTTYYTMLFISAYLFFFSTFSVQNRLRLVGAYILFPLLLSAVQLIPFTEYVANANRPITNIDYASWGNLTIPGFITFIFPLLFGNHVDGNWWGPQWILGGFAGVPTLVLLVIGIVKAKFPLKLFTLLGLLFALLLAMGKITPLFYIFYYLIPGWRFFRAPSGLVEFYTFFTSIIVAYGLTAIESKKVSFGRKTIVGAIISSVIVVVCLIALIVSNKSSFWHDAVVFLTQKGHIHALSRLLIYSTPKIESIFNVGIWNMFFFTLFLSLTFLALLILKKKEVLIISLLLLTTISLVIPDSKVVTTASLSLYNMNLPVPRVLSATQDGAFRALSIQIDLHQKRENLPGKDFFYREAVGNINMYKDDNNIERHIYQARGYSALAPTSYATYLHSNDPVGVTGVDVTHMTLSQLNQVGIKYLISHEPLSHDAYNNVTLLPIATSPGRYYIYENTTAIPRASLVGDGTVSIIKSEPSRIEIVGETAKPTKLILSDWYYPGWKAIVNGKETPIYSYKTAFRQINVPAGNLHVTFVYQPITLKIGALITLLSLISWLVFWFWKRKGKIS